MVDPGVRERSQTCPDHVPSRQREYECGCPLQESTSGTDDGGVHVAVVDTDSIQSLLRKDSTPTDELSGIDFAVKRSEDL